jgi:hypothetical protein
MYLAILLFFLGALAGHYYAKENNPNFTVYSRIIINLLFCFVYWFLFSLLFTLINENLMLIPTIVGVLLSPIVYGFLLSMGITHLFHL